MDNIYLYGRKGKNIRGHVQKPMAGFVSPRNHKKSNFLRILSNFQLFLLKLSGVMYYAITNSQNLEFLKYFVNWARYG